MHEGGVFRIWTSHTCITLYTYVIWLKGKVRAPALCLRIIFSDYMFSRLGDSKKDICAPLHLLTLGHILNPSCRSNVESRWCSVGWAHFKGTDACWFWLFTGCFCGRQTAWGLDWIIFLANQYVSPGLYLSKCEQTWCDKEAILYTRTKARSSCPFVLWFNIIPHPCFNSWTKIIEKKRGLRGQSLINSRAGLEIQISPVRPWPNVLERTLRWRTWIWCITALAMKGQRLGGVWWGWGEGRESGPQNLIEQPDNSREVREDCEDRVWSEELDSMSIRFVLPGLGRVSQKELYFDELGFGEQLHQCWRGKGLVFGNDGVKEGKGGSRIS